jgi:hypothetical protein
MKLKNWKQNKFFKSLKENWYFIRQDIVSYLTATLLYVSLCLMKDFTVQSAIYGIFDCLVFYVPFWYIRINFKDTYHSDNWEHCKKWTRIMLNSGVFVLFVLPIKYSLFNGLFVAFVCCLILYLVSIEVNEKKLIIKQNKELQKYISDLLIKYENPKDKLVKLCAEMDISARDTLVATLYYIEKYKPKQIWYWLLENNQNMELDSVYKLLNRLNKKLLNKIN